MRQKYWNLTLIVLGGFLHHRSLKAQLLNECTQMLPLNTFLKSIFSFYQYIPLSLAENIVQFKCVKQFTNNIGRVLFTPRNLSAVVFGANSMEYKPKKTIRIQNKDYTYIGIDKCAFLGLIFLLVIISGVEFFTVAKKSLFFKNMPIYF